MMKNFRKIFTGCLAVSLISCVSSNQSSTPIKFQQPPIRIEPVVSIAPVETDSMIPFTRDLYYRLKNNNQDIRKLQFFVDQTIVLSRGLDQSKLFIDQGKVMNQTGVNENKIELLALTPGVVQAIEPDGLKVAFEKGSNTIKFINNKYSPDFFSFTGTNWDNGTAEIPYNGTTYRVSCGTCGSIADAKLVVRQKDVMSGSINSKTLPGVTLGN
jgi:hypothetical protein